MENTFCDDNLSCLPKEQMDKPEWITHFWRDFPAQLLRVRQWRIYLTFAVTLFIVTKLEAVSGKDILETHNSQSMEQALIGPGKQTCAT